MNCRFFCLGGLMVLSLAAQGASLPAGRPGEVDVSILKGLRPGHPRLVATESDIERVRRAVKADPQVRRLYEDLRKKADDLLNTPPEEYKLIGPRLLRVSQSAVDRIYTLGLLYRLDRDRRHAERAVRELLAVSAFPDWNPSHFLDTAEMTHAAGIGYDWFHDVLTPDQRAIVRKAIIEKGLEPAAEAYRGGKYGWWVRVSHNWNQVCNGGIGIGALAIADEKPDLTAFILDSALASLPLAIAQFGPDGGCAEGPGYWSYATRYTVYFLAAMQTALGHDAGLSKIPGFDKAGDFRLCFVSPTSQTFNYADAQEQAGSPAEMLWLARRFDRPAYARHYWQNKPQPSPFDLLWFEPGSDGTARMQVPLDRFFRGVDVAFLRSDWDDPAALWVGFKGGDNKANHSHLDLGTFVLDALGRRWALDLGRDDYNLPGYFGKERFTYYRLRTEGHNTLCIDGRNQPFDAGAPIMAFGSEQNRAHAVADLSAAYSPGAKRVLRGIAMLDRKHVLVQDEIDLAGPAEVVWAMHTKAKVDLASQAATLTLDDAHLRAQVLSPAGAKFEVVSVEQKAPQNTNEGVRKLLVRLPKASGATRIAVLLTPYRQAPAERKVELCPLAEW